MSLPGILCWCFAVVVFADAQTPPSDGELRLTGSGHPREGRLEVFYQGTWGTVCDDNFGLDEAGVACWQLGFGREGSSVSTIWVYTSNPPMLLDDLDCNGTEARLEDCRHRPWGINDCKEVEHVSVSCQEDPCRNSPCQNNGTCITANDGNITCLCSSITFGKMCEHFIDFCSVGNGGCSHKCINLLGSYVCACPDDELWLNADGHTCYAPSVEVQCGRTMEVAFPRSQWVGLKEQCLTMSNSSCVATGNATHITVSVPLYGCGTHYQALQDGFVFENQISTHDAPIAGLVSRVRDVNMTLRCHYDNELLLSNWYIVNSGQIHFSDMSQGHYSLSMELFHNGQQYVGGSLGKLEPGEDLSIKFSLSTNDSSLQVFARNCKATPSAPGSSSTQYLFLDEGCGKDPHFRQNQTAAGTQETLQLQAFQFLTDNSTSATLLVHCDVIVCDSSHPGNRCTQGCLTSSDEGGLVLGGDADAVVGEEK